MSYKMEQAIREYTQELSRQNKLAWFPYNMLHILEENLPHGLVIELGETILRCKGIGKNNI